GAIGELFSKMAWESPLLEPDWLDEAAAANRELAERIGGSIQQETGLVPLDRLHAGWLGIQCPSVRAAVWMMRALVAQNVLSRREGLVLFVPVNAARDPRGVLVAAAVAGVY